MSKIFGSFFAVAAFGLAALSSLSAAPSDTTLSDAALSTSVAALPVPASSDTPTSPAEAAANPAYPELIQTKHFAGRSAYRAFDLSPSGARLAIVHHLAGRQELQIVNAETLERSGRYSVPINLTVDWIEWAGEEKVIYLLSQFQYWFGTPVRFSRIYVRDIGTGESWPLDVDSRLSWGGEVLHVDADGKTALVSVQDKLRNTPSVFRYELKKGGAVDRVVKHKGGVWDWYADNDGVVRLGMGWKGRRLRVYYREDEGSKFRLVGKLKADDAKSRYWDVYQIVSGKSTGYVIEEGENGRMGVRLFDYSTGEPLSTFYEHPDWDVEALRMKPDGTPLAASYTDDREQIVWFDEEAEKLHQEMKAALKMDDVYIIDRSDENERMLIYAGSEADPGAIYLYTPSQQRLALFGNNRPDLDFQLLVKPKPVRFTARDGLEIAAYLTLPRGREPKNLPLIIVPHGGPFGVRDSLLYNDEVQLLANRGYAVLQPNFRGSGGYGDALFDAGNGQVGRGMQDDLDDAMDWAVGEGIADPARVCVVGGSYGGYAALWGVLRNPERYRCAASWAGVTDWDKMLKYDRKYLTRKAGRVWQTRIEGDEEFDLEDVSPMRHASRLSRPVLLVHGTHDTNVPISQFEDFRKAAKKAPVQPTYLKVYGEGHSFSKADNEQRWYDALDAFLAEHNPADQVDAKGELRIKPVPIGVTAKSIELPKSETE